MTTHTITDEIEIRFTPAGKSGDAVAYPEIEITFEYSPGRPATGPSYACGGTPEEPAQIEFIGAKVIRGDDIEIELTGEQIAEYAEAWLYDDGYQAALDEVQADYERRMPE